MHATPAPHQVVIEAHLRARKSHCEIVRQIREDDEDGDLVTVRCDARAKVNLPNAEHGVSVDRLSPCQVVFEIGGVQRPRKYSISNCRGKLTVTNAGSRWTRGLLKSAGIEPSRLEYVYYQGVPHRAGCYRTTIVYDRFVTTGDTPFDDKSAARCVPMASP